MSQSNRFYLSKILVSIIDWAPQEDCIVFTVFVQLGPLNNHSYHSYNINIDVTITTIIDESPHAAARTSCLVPFKKGQIQEPITSSLDRCTGTCTDRREMSRVLFNN